MTPRNASSSSRPRRVALRAATGIVLAIGAVSVTAVVLAAKHEDAAPDTGLDVPAPDFVLRDQNGQLTSLAQFRGKTVVMAFIDPVCTQICPLTTQSMVRALDLLGPAAASRVQLLGVDANPSKTSVADVAEYTRVHGLAGRWRFLTGSPARLATVWHRYHVYVNTASDGDVIHQALIVLIDSTGHERRIVGTPMRYSAVGEQAHVIADWLADLLPRGLDLAPSGGPAPAAPVPLRRVRFTALGSRHDTVDVAGAGAPAHLIVYFASWLGSPAALAKRLAPLDAYGALARRRGWPAPVAVDELPTEPSAAGARGIAMRLTTGLEAPILEDASGRLADGAHVEDLPWYVLTSPAGKLVVWHHDGWLSSAQLRHDVAEALDGH